MPSKTEKEKMLAGELYTFFDPELMAARRKVKELLRLYNQTHTDPERQDLLKKIVGGIGHDSMIESPFNCTYGKNIHMGDHVYLNFNCVILDNNTVRFGSYVMVGPAVQFYTAAHPLQAEPRNQGWEVAKAIVIEDNVWIGGGAILLPGIHIGRNAVIGAGAVVTKDVPAFTVVAGNPARVIREIEQEN